MLHSCGAFAELHHAPECSQCIHSGRVNCTHVTSYFNVQESCEEHECGSGYRDKPKKHERMCIITLNSPGCTDEQCCDKKVQSQVRLHDDAKPNKCMLTITRRIDALVHRDLARDTCARMGGQTSLARRAFSVTTCTVMTPAAASSW